MDTNKLLIIFFFIINIYGYAQIGIGTSNPKASLHVEGNAIIREVDEADIENDTQLFWNPETGEIETVEKNEFPIFVVTYKVAANSYRASVFEESRDYIKSFDTGIPKDRYEVTILSAYPTFNFVSENNYNYYNLGDAENPLGDGIYGKYLGIKHIYGNKKIFNGDEFVSHGVGVKDKDVYRDSFAGNIDPVSNIDCYKGNENWEITADYVHASPPDNGTGYNASWPNWTRYVVFVWHFKLLVIDKGYSRTIEKDAEIINGANVITPTGGFDKNPIDTK